VSDPWSRRFLEGLSIETPQPGVKSVPSARRDGVKATDGPAESAQCAPKAQRSPEMSAHRISRALRRRCVWRGRRALGTGARTPCVFPEIVQLREVQPTVVAQEEAAKL
jgi:hypothetical protein